MKRIGDKLQAVTQILSLPTAHSKVLDICMAPGGYSASVLRYSPQAHISAITLPSHLDGFRVMVDYGYKDPRVKVLFADVTMFAAEYGVSDIPKDHPDFEKLVSRRPFAGETFDLVFCDGQVLRAQTPHVAKYREENKATRLTCSQLILGLQRLKPGGTFIILLHKPEMWNTVKLLSLLDTISEIQLLKPTVAHKTRSSFYLVAKNVQSQNPEALRAIADWKSTWKKLTFPPSLEEKEQEQQQPDQTQMEIRKAHDLLTSFGERLLKLGEPVWLIQRDALKNAPWLKNTTTRPSGHTDGPSGSRTSDVLAEKTAPSSVWSDLHGR